MDLHIVGIERVNKLEMNSSEFTLTLTLSLGGRGNNSLYSK